MIVAVTAAPGLQRLAYIMGLSIGATGATVGRVATDMAWASFFSLCSGGAVSGQLMAKWNRVCDSGSRRRLSIESWIWQLCGAILSAMFAVALEYWDLVDSVPSVIIFAVGFSAWQVEKTKAIAESKLAVLSVFEGLLLLAICTIAALAPTAWSLPLYGCVLLVAAVVTQALPRFSDPVDCAGAPVGLGYLDTGKLALNGVVSSGREQLLVPAVRLLAGNGAAGAVAQVSSIVAGLMLGPRALANNFVPQLSRHEPFSEKARGVLKRYERAMRSVLGILVAGVAALAIVASTASILPGYRVTAALAALALIAGQASLLPSTVLTVRQSVGPILVSAAWVTCVWAIVVAGMTMLRSRIDFAAEMLLCFSILAAVARAMYLYRKISPNNGASDDKRPVTIPQYRCSRSVTD